MPKPNEYFKLSVNDVDLIESALRQFGQLTSVNTKAVNDLLGRLHNQKIFYRPKDKVYVGG